MPRQRFKSAATSRGFKGIGQSLQASRGEIEKKTRRDVDALKLAKMQAAENAKSYIGGLSDAGRFEETVLKEKHRLEDKVRSRQYEALSIKADRDVDRLKGEAEEAKKFADHWKDLAPKMAKVAGDFTLGALQLEDQLRGIAEWNKLYDSGQLQSYLGAHGAEINKLTTKAINDLAVVPPDEANAGLDRLRLTSKFAQRKLLGWVKENKTQIGNEVREKWNSANKDGDPNNLESYGEKTAVLAMDTAARELLKHLGIKEGSHTGVAVIEQYRALGVLDQVAAREQRLFKETETRRLDLVQQFKNAPEGSIDRKVLFNELFLATRNGTFKVNGKIQDANKVGAMNPADAMVETLRYIAQHDDSIDHTNIESRFAEYYTIPLSKDGMTAKKMASLKNFKPELIVQKLKGSGRWETEVVDYVKALGAQKSDLKNKAQKDKGFSFLANGSDFSNKVNEYSENGWQSGEIYELIDMVENAGLNNQDRAEAFKRFGYIIGNAKYTPNGHLKNVLRHFSPDGDVQEGIKIYALTKGGLTQAEKSFLNQNVEFFQKLSEAIPATEAGGAQGMEGLIIQVQNKFKTREDINPKTSTKGLSTSGLEKSYLAAENIINELKDSLVVVTPTGKKESEVPFSALLQNAKTKEFEKIDSAGQIKWSKIDGNWTLVYPKDSQNPYDYIRYSRPGTKTFNFIYPYQNQDQVEEAKVNAEILLKEDNVEDVTLDFGDKGEDGEGGLIPLNTNHMRLGLLEGHYDRGQYLGHPRLTGDVGKWKTALDAMVAGEDYTLPEYSPNIVAMSNIPIADIKKNTPSNQFTKRQLMQIHLNHILRNKYPPGQVPQIPLDNEDQNVISYGSPFNSRDRFAVGIFAACSAQGVTCQSKAMEAYTAGLGNQFEGSWVNGEFIPSGTNFSSPQESLSQGALFYQPQIVDEWLFRYPRLNRIYGNPGPRTLPKRSRE